MSIPHHLIFIVKKSIRHQQRLGTLMISTILIVAFKEELEKLMQKENQNNDCRSTEPEH